MLRWMAVHAACHRGHGLVCVIVVIKLRLSMMVTTTAGSALARQASIAQGRRRDGWWATQCSLGGTGLAAATTTSPGRFFGHGRKCLGGGGTLGRASLRPCCLLFFIGIRHWNYNFGPFSYNFSFGGYGILVDNNCFRGNLTPRSITRVRVSLVTHTRVRCSGTAFFITSVNLRGTWRRARGSLRRVAVPL